MFIFLQLNVPAGLWESPFMLSEVKKKKRNGVERQTFVGVPPSEAHKASLWETNWSGEEKKKNMQVLLKGVQILKSAK